jgi:hypothetical protein
MSTHPIWVTAKSNTDWKHGEFRRTSSDGWADHLQSAGKEIECPAGRRLPLHTSYKNEKGVTSINTFNLRSPTKDMMNFAAWENAHALTLTFKQVIHNMGNFERIDAIKAEENVRHFLMRLNRALLRRKLIHQGYRLGSIAVLEGISDGRLHCHAMIECPPNVSIENLEKCVALAWGQTRWGHKEIDVKPCRDDGWLNYILKRKTKSDFGESMAFSAWSKPLSIQISERI